MKDFKAFKSEKCYDFECVVNVKNGPLKSTFKLCTVKFKIKFIFYLIFDDIRSNFVFPLRHLYVYSQSTE